MTRLLSTGNTKVELILCNAFEVPFEGKLRFAGVEEERVRQYRADARREAVRSLCEVAADAGLKEDGYLAVTAHGDAATRILE